MLIFLDFPTGFLESAQQVSDFLKTRVVATPGLEEHHRHGVGFLSEEDFQQRVAEFFSHSDELCFGDETANEAYSRFSAAIDRICSTNYRENLIAVSHGTVISLFVSQHNGTPAFGLWKKLGLPSFVVLELPSLKTLLVRYGLT